MRKWQLRINIITREVKLPNIFSDIRGLAGTGGGTDLGTGGGSLLLLLLLLWSLLQVLWMTLFPQGVTVT